MKLKPLFSMLVAAVIAATLMVPAFAINTDGEAKAVHNMTNAQRRASGLGSLKWDSTLVKAAQLRAEESARYYTSDHTRPDGSKYYTTNALVWGENTAFGQVNAERVMNAWMNSKSHKDNILDERFTIMGAACVVTEDSIYWVQLFGTGESNYSWSNVENYSIGGKNVVTGSGAGEVSNDAADLEKSDAESVAAANRAARSGGAVDGNGEVVPNAIAAELTKAISQERGKTVAIRVKDADSIAPATLNTLARLANEEEKIALIDADTMSAGGKSVQGRMVLEPAKLTGRSNSLKLGVYVDKESVAAVKAAMADRYSGAMAFVHMGHNGHLGATLKVSAKVNVEGLDVDRLFISIYNPVTGEIDTLIEPNYYVDNSNFLHFYTSIGGDVVITDKPID